MAERVDAVTGAFGGHAVGKRQERAVEVTGGRDWLEAAFAATTTATTSIAALIAVAFEINFFEVKRVVVEAGCFPVVAGDRPAAGTGPALLIDLFPAGCSHVF